MENIQNNCSVIMLCG